MTKDLIIFCSGFVMGCLSIMFVLKQAVKTILLTMREFKLHDDDDPADFWKRGNLDDE